MSVASCCDACGKFEPMQFGGAHPVGWVLIRVVPAYEAYVAAQLAGGPPPDTDKAFCSSKCAQTFLMLNEGVTL